MRLVPTDLRAAVFAGASFCFARQRASAAMTVSLVAPSFSSAAISIRIRAGRRFVSSSVKPRRSSTCTSALISADMPTSPNSATNISAPGLFSTDLIHWGRAGFLGHPARTRRALNLRTLSGSGQSRSGFGAKITRPKDNWDPTTKSKGRGRWVVAIRSLLAEKVFQPEETARLVAAYERALHQLNLKDRTDPVTSLVAKKIIELSGSCDGGPEKVCAMALEDLGIPRRA